MKASSVIRAALDPHNRVSTRPTQSVSEEQTRSSMNPMHGLAIWGSLVRFVESYTVASSDAKHIIYSYFMRKTSHTVADNVRDGVGNVRDGVRDGVRNMGNGASESTPVE